MIEIYKDIKGYEGYYQVSNKGNVKSLKRNMFNGKVWWKSKEKTLKGRLTGKGYFSVYLMMDRKGKQLYIHQLVAQAFLGHEPCGHKIVVDHIDNNPLNNNISNIQIISQRENSSKDRKGTSIYTGVHKCSGGKKWRSIITVNGEQKRLGSFTNEKDASDAYQKELSKINNK